MPLDFNELRQLLVTIAQTDIAELILKSDDFELTVRKAFSTSNQLLPEGLVAAELTTTPATTQIGLGSGLETVTNLTDVGNAPIPGTSSSTSIDQRFVDVTSPMVGTFYRSPAPSEPPFVEVSDRIYVGQTVCIIEAMKLMNEIEAEVSGQIIEILVQNGEPVEYGQPLMRVNPS